MSGNLGFIQMVETKQVNIDLKRTVPLFSDTVLVANIVKTHPENKENKNKGKAKKESEGFVTLVFVDSVSQQAIARIVLPKITAENLETALKSNLENFGKDNKDNKKIDKKEIASSKPNNRYFG